MKITKESKRLKQKQRDIGLNDIDKNKEKKRRDSERLRPRYNLCAAKYYDGQCADIHWT